MGADGDPADLARAHAAQRHLAVQAAVVEPRPVEALRGLALGRAPVDVDHEPVHPAGQPRPHGERRVGAAVRSHRAPVEVDVGLEGRRGEVDRVVAARHADVAPVPALRAAEGDRRRRAPERLRVGGVGDPDRAPAEGAGGPARRDADPVRVGGVAPAGRQRDAPRGAGVGHRPRAARRHRRGQQRGQHGGERGGQHAPGTLAGGPESRRAARRG